LHTRFSRDWSSDVCSSDLLLHKETVSGQVQLDRVKVAKGKILTATRKPLDSSFNEKSILSITDTGIQKILLSYLKAKGIPEIARSEERRVGKECRYGRSM